MTVNFPCALISANSIVRIFRRPEPFVGPDGTRHPAWGTWTEDDWVQKVPGWELVPVIETPPDIGVDQVAEATGWSVNGSSVVRTYTVRPKTPVEFDADKQIKTAQVNALRDAKMAQGVPFTFPAPHGTLTVQTRGAPYDDRDNLQTILIVANDYITGSLPGDGADEQMNPFRTAENVDVPVTAGLVKTMCLTVQSVLGAIRQHSFGLKNQIAAATTYAELAAIDIETGWP